MGMKRKTPKWNMKEMDRAIKSMKNKKCRDAQGLINDLFKPGVAGNDFKVSLLSLLNYTNKYLEIPQMMKNVNIALIPKPGKRKLEHIENHRGIFLINKFRSLLMKLVLNDKYSIIDDFMSDSNIALLRSIEGGVLIGIKCKIKSRVFIWSPFDLNERIKIKILCLFHKKIFFYPKKL